jgi:hypothetical protein
MRKITEESLTLKMTISILLAELSPSLEAANCPATQELPSILWNPRVYYMFTRALHWSLS